MNQIIDNNPRKQFDESVSYAICQAEGIADIIKRSGKVIDGLSFLELGPGADFAAQLVLASMGAKVTLADLYLAPWDDAYHPAFYRAFLNEWNGPRQTVEKAIEIGGYDGILTCLKEPAENLTSLKAGQFDFVYSNAVLEHIRDLDATVSELARVTAPAGVHAHQIDLRDHRDFDRPLAYLLMDGPTYAAHREKSQCSHGCRWRMPDFVSAFSRHFWIWQQELQMFEGDEYVLDVMNNLPADSPYRGWPLGLMRCVGGRLWAIRKQAPDDHRERGSSAWRRLFSR